MKHLLVFLFAFPAFALPQERAPLPQNQAPAQSALVTKRIGDFAAWLLVTSDADWVRQWNMPSANVPRFTEADRVAYGGTLTVLIFFANPTANSDGDMELSCDIKVTRPDHSHSINENNLKCAYRQVPKENPHHVQLAGTVVTYAAEPGDLAGRWTVSVTLTDNVAGLDFPLETSFELVAESD